MPVTVCSKAYWETNTVVLLHVVFSRLICKYLKLNPWFLCLTAWEPHNAKLSRFLNSQVCRIRDSSSAEGTSWPWIIYQSLTSNWRWKLCLFVSVCLCLVSTTFLFIFLSLSSTVSASYTHMITESLHNEVRGAVSFWIRRHMEQRGCKFMLLSKKR